MLISRNWLQSYFDSELPKAEALGEALTFHAFEIEEIQTDDILDVKITPNRGHDCLCHWGIAKELSAILNIPIKSDMGKSDLFKLEPITPALAVTIEDPQLCRRYIAGFIHGVKVGPSPQWLKEKLEAIGQRSINNVVDATNYVMFDLGQPLHAFDASKLTQRSGGYTIGVRKAKKGEKLRALDENEYTLDDSTLVIVDALGDLPGQDGKPIGVAGVKGGMPASITEATTDIIIESANFDGASVRKTAQALKLRTDASQRFEQEISPELAAHGMLAVVELIVKVAGGALIGFRDVYPAPQVKRSVSVSTDMVNHILGVSFTGAEVADAFERLALPYREDDGVFEVAAPSERLDLEIPEDLVEEVGRIQGYDKVPAIELPAFSGWPEINQMFYWSERFREALQQQGFSEIYTSTFSDSGERVVRNKVDGVRPFLRASLVPGLKAALAKNIQTMQALNLPEIKLFEIGTVFSKEGERVMLAVGVHGKKRERKEEFMLDLGHAIGFGVTIAPPDYVTQIDLTELTGEFGSLPHMSHANVGIGIELPLSSTERYQPFSRYPYIVRDVAFWVPKNTDEKNLGELLKKEAGQMCVKISLFDTFEKETKTSLAFRLIFQSTDRTLTDEEVNAQMEKVYDKLKAEGFEIR